MADKHLKLAPHSNKPGFWWYEEKRGICLCTEAFDNQGCKQVTINYLTWNSIRAALKRKDKK